MKRPNGEKADNPVIVFCFVLFSQKKKKTSRNGIFKKEQIERYVVPTALEFCSHFHEAVWHWAGEASADDWHITMREARPQTSLTCVLLWLAQLKQAALQKKIKAPARLIPSCANKINKSAENAPCQRLPSVHRQQDAFWNLTRICMR